LKAHLPAFQLEAIKQTKVDMQVYLGNYPLATDNGTAYTRQRDVLKEAIQTYGTDHIAGVTVGNEFMLKYVFQLPLKEFFEYPACLAI
jgi:exo-beta-1,3-glucanase (GH17 family)